MSESFVFKTVDGKLYEVFDESHIVGLNTWILITENKRNIIMYFGSRKFVPPGSMSDSGRIVIKQLENYVKDNIERRTCIGQNIFYIPESVVGMTWKEGKLTRELWDMYMARQVEKTERVVEVFEKKF